MLAFIVAGSFIALSNVLEDITFISLIRSFLNESSGVDLYTSEHD